MSGDSDYETPLWPMLWLGLAFAILVGVGIFTVLIPELEDRPAENADEAIEPADD